MVIEIESLSREIFFFVKYYCGNITINNNKWCCEKKGNSDFIIIILNSYNIYRGGAIDRH